MPTHAQGEVKRDYWAIFDQIQAEDQAAVAEGRRRAKRFIAKWQPLVGHPDGLWDLAAGSSLGTR